MTEKRIVLRKNRAHVVQFDAADLPLWNSRRWYVSATNYLFSVSKVAGKQQSVYFARLAMGCVPGDKKVVDHINHDTLDNRRQNLRTVTNQVNLRNRKPRNFGSHPEPGVCFDKRSGKWMAYVKVNYRMTTKLFVLEQDAIETARSMRSGW